jgi:hypothetical protein
VLGSRRLALLALAFLMLTACGGQSSAAKHPTPTPTPTPSPSPSFDIAALAAAFAGTYKGSWTNRTFGSSGDITAVVTFDRATLTVTANLTIGGQVFGGPPPAPESFSGKLGDLGSLGFSGHSPTFGDFTVTSTGPTFVMKAQNVPGGRVDHFEADGLLTGTSINCTYKVFLKDGTAADGVCSLARA